MNNNIVLEIANKVKEKGGNTYYVGGYVRDLFLKIENKDIDIEVHGIEEEDLKRILKEVGEPLEFGKDFGIYSLKGTNIDIALPRSEVNTGLGHRDFKVEVNPFIGTKEAARRRDFTINSMMIDVLTNELIDHYNGKSDLDNKILRHVDDKSFIEDPLRVYRAAQFVSRFNLSLDDDTAKLCSNIDVSKLSKQRVEEELKKALLKADKPSLFFDSLKKMNKFDYWFKEIGEMIGHEQNPLKHPEGDVYNHTMMALDEASLYRNEVSNSYNYMLLTLVHDFGKLKTRIMTESGWHFYGHENYHEDIKLFLERLISNNETKEYILEMTSKHMRGHKIFKDNLNVYDSNKWFDGVKYPKDLVYLAVADKSNHRDPKRMEFLMERYNLFVENCKLEEVSGQDLIDNGIEPNVDFQKYLKYSHDLRLQGIKKEEALSKTLEYINERQ